MNHANMARQYEILNWIRSFLSDSGFMPHIHCYQGKRSLAWTMFTTDMLIGIAYVGISITLWGLVSKIRIRFNRVIICFGIFILACGLTHFMEGWTLWHPDYWATAWIKVITAATSIGTGIYLFRLRYELLEFAEAAKLSEQRRFNLEALTVELKVTRDRLEQIIHRSLGRMATMEEILLDIIDTSIEIADTDFGIIQLFNSETQELEIVAQRGFSEQWLSFWKCASKNQGVYSSPLKSRTRMIVEDILTSPVFSDPEILEMQLSVGIKSIQMTPLLNRSGRIIGMFSTHRKSPGAPAGHTLDVLDSLARLAADTIEQSQLRRRLGESEEKYSALEQANQAQEAFLGVLSHELRTPLTAILSWAEILKRGEAREDRLLRGLEVIEENAKAQGQLVDDLLDITRINSGKLSLNLQSMVPDRIISDAIEMIQPEAEKKMQCIDKELSGLIGTLYGDPVRMKQILWNLLSNSIKFTPKCGQIRIILRELDGKAQIQVSDNGKGFTPSVGAKLFARFSQGDASTTRNFGGLGLGLVLVKNLTEMQGGTVRAQSLGLNRGATFILEFPIINLRQIETDDVSESQIETSLRNIRILLVDDEKTIGDAISHLLEDLGATVNVTNSAEETFKSLLQTLPDVLVSDIAMPVEDGYSLIRRIRMCASKEFKNLPAIAMTAFTGVESRKKAIEAGFNGYVMKPIDITLLAKKINQSLKITD